ncbi:MAG: FKBP-type peptidyl-prolyl cis-trans isomerase [Acidimicrobiales bacterium]
MRRLLLAPVLLLAVLLAACGGGGNGTTSSTTTTTSASTTTTAASSSTTGGSTTTAPSTTTTSAAVPAVAQPTDLTVQPVVSAGTPPPPTKLVTKDLVVGTGPTATASSTVDVKYVGANYTTGQDFTSSTWTTGKATSFALTTVIKGFAQGIEGMKVGGRREIVIPPSLGYGSHGSGSSVQPNETLVFVVDLKGVS